MALTFYSYLVSAKTKYSYFFKVLDFQLAKTKCKLEGKSKRRSQRRGENKNFLEQEIFQPVKMNSTDQLKTPQWPRKMQTSTTRH